MAPLLQLQTHHAVVSIPRLIRLNRGKAWLRSSSNLMPRCAGCAQPAPCHRKTRWRLTLPNTRRTRNLTRAAAVQNALTCVIAIQRDGLISRRAARPCHPSCRPARSFRHRELSRHLATDLHLAKQRCSRIQLAVVLVAAMPRLWFGVQILSWSRNCNRSCRRSKPCWPNPAAFVLTRCGPLLKISMTAMTIVALEFAHYFYSCFCNLFVFAPCLAAASVGAQNNCCICCNALCREASHRKPCHVTTGCCTLDCACDMKYVLYDHTSIKLLLYMISARH